MFPTVQIDPDLKRLLKEKSEKLGVDEVFLVNRYVFDGLFNEDDPLNKPDAEKVTTLADLAGCIKTDESTNAVEIVRKLRGKD